MTHAVVLVSGGDAVSPFTTPEAACSSGLAAGNTNTYLRERLLAAGHAVYTAPAMNARSAVVDAEPGSFGAFGGQPEILPAHMTIISNGDIDNAGEHLTRFVHYLHETRGVTEISFVGHSNGGLFATAAIRTLRDIGAGIRVRTLVTLGTPWMGTMPLRVSYDEVPADSLLGDSRALAIVDALRKHADATDAGLARQDTYDYLLGSDGWLAAQAGVLNDLSVLLVGGTWLEHDGGDKELWPFDGLVSEYSALAKGVDLGIIPNRIELSVPLLHSIFLANVFTQPWETGMTWNLGVFEAVNAHLVSNQT